MDRVWNCRTASIWFPRSHVRIRGEGSRGENRRASAHFTQLTSTPRLRDFFSTFVSARVKHLSVGWAWMLLYQFARSDKHVREGGPEEGSNDSLSWDTMEHWTHNRASQIRTGRQSTCCYKMDGFFQTQLAPALLCESKTSRFSAEASELRTCESWRIRKSNP
ncbi:hypothetical protein B0T19DRAFT_27462 [Cercophora scortea]|uniref:Uncharacterized protein n=1 Tax=Cercophora scortea TaxID=314031 RepID=A0AAE0J4H5_9PEZI|nr:hypothetical protein B0T19DRAFT_27462 [Cercophora scortea]